MIENLEVSSSPKTYLHFRNPLTWVIKNHPSESFVSFVSIKSKIDDFTPSSLILNYFKFLPLQLT